MSEEKDENNGSDEQDTYPAQVASVRDPHTLVINRGSEHGINKGQRFMVYTLSEEEIEDPETEDSLGHLEIVKGTGRATHVQEKMTTIKSDKTDDSPKRKGGKKRPGPMGGGGGAPGAMGGGGPMGGGGGPANPMGGGGPGGGLGGGGGNPLAAMAAMQGGGMGMGQQPSNQESEPTVQPFEDPEVGDLVRRANR